MRNRRCGAKTRSGARCRLRPVGPWNDRCALHGGLSTGPRTPEGRARIAEAQRRRWALWREERVLRSGDADFESGQTVDPSVAP
ncbi:MAG: HGGxSTG domain-containing protein [Pseudomonadota bacterium]|nr:HGGxSTG domain-containing protein [Pseudomonadota bacterium]MEE3099602.1 HGGxSTG domain-containing protein [Pseudomonadota bacterium]